MQNPLVWTNNTPVLLYNSSSHFNVSQYFWLTFILCTYKIFSIFPYKYTTYNFKNKKFYNSFPSDTLQKQCSQTLVFTTAKSGNRRNKNLRALKSIQQNDLQSKSIISDALKLTPNSS